jgi:secreted trypsin-like serine protease
MHHVRGLTRAFVALATAVTALNLVPATAAHGVTPSPYVVGGTTVAEGTFPFLALLLLRSTSDPNAYSEYCGGSLVGEQWVLTAAHCVGNGAPAQPDAILIGRMVASDTSSGEFESADQVFVNPGFNPTTAENDTALIHLTHPAAESEIRVVDESQDGAIAAGTQATVIGAGETQPNDPNSQPAQVYQAPQNVLSDTECRNTYGPDFVAGSMLCAGQPGVSPCFGDSGGPLFVAAPSGWLQFGVVSHGPQQCGAQPGVYARLSAERTWIRDTMATVPDTMARLAGADRLATAIAVSTHAFPAAGSAGAVVLADADTYADALPGTPLAAAKHGPLLLNPNASLDPRVQAEIQRVLPAGAPVYLLGGPTALSTNIESALNALGYSTTRYGGDNRFATAVAIAGQGLGDPTTVFEATGLGFADALSGGAVAVASHGAVLLTEGATQAPATATYLAAHGADTRYALGGPAASADPTATPLVGADRYETSVRVANQFFPSATTFGAADGMAFPDALAGGAHIGALGGPLLLVPPVAPLAPSLVAYLAGHSAAFTSGFLYGGPGAADPEILGELVQLSS